MEISCSESEGDDVEEGIGDGPSSKGAAPNRLFDSKSRKRKNYAFSRSRRRPRMKYGAIHTMPQLAQLFFFLKSYKYCCLLFLVLSNKPRKNSVAANHNITEEELTKLREGNPKFFYPKRVRFSNGKRVTIKTYKCYLCPTQYMDFSSHSKHMSLHGAGLKYNCQVCSYSVDRRDLLTIHLKTHRLQGNIPEDQLTVPPKIRKSGFSSATKMGLGLGSLSDDEIPLLGNEEDFEFEYDIEDDEVLSDSEVFEFQPGAKRLKTGIQIDFADP
jgi:hypothetical protein